MSGVQASPVTDNAERRRFELTEQGLVAFADYLRQEKADGQLVLNLYHVEAPVALRGTGAASRLMEGVQAHARAEGLKIVPTCAYAAAWFTRHPEARDVLA